MADLWKAIPYLMGEQLLTHVTSVEEGCVMQFTMLKPLATYLEKTQN